MVITLWEYFWIYLVFFFGLFAARLFSISANFHRLFTIFLPIWLPNHAISCFIQFPIDYLLAYGLFDIGNHLLFASRRKHLKTQDTIKTKFDKINIMATWIENHRRVYIFSEKVSLDAMMARHIKQHTKNRNIKCVNINERRCRLGQVIKANTPR